VARIVLNTFGSLGDLHPYLAIAIGLRKRGHHAVVATSEVYRRKVGAEGVAFAPVRPDLGPLADDAQFLARVWHPRRGSEFLLRDYLIPQVEQSYEDLLDACRGADLLLTHTAGFAGPIVAEVLKLPWLSVALQPLVFFSAYDPPVIPGAEWARHVYGFGPGVFQALMALARLRLDRWASPIRNLRRRVGLSASKNNPLLDTFSPFGTLALFSKSFAGPQADWPANVYITGFVYYDRPGGLPGAWNDDVDLEVFLRSGPVPVLFTLGSSAAMHTGEFFRESIAAVHGLGVRAVLVAGRAWTEIHNPLPDSILVAGYVPFSKIMPRVAAVVHPGGIGTIAQSLRAGRPMLVTPGAHDQPDNAERVRRLGLGRVIPRSRYYAPRVGNELGALLTNVSYRERANEMAASIAEEDGVTNACEAVEEMVERTGRSVPVVRE
jgi:UDP:flavonoid glycosyltransferase YjiC (YdhE family)